MNFTPTDLWKAHNNFLFPYRSGRFKGFIRPEEELGKGKDLKENSSTKGKERPAIFCISVVWLTPSGMIYSPSPKFSLGEAGQATGTEYTSDH